MPSGCTARALSALAVVTALASVPGPARAQAPPCVRAKPGAPVEEIIRRPEVCLRVAAMQAAELAVLRQAMAGLLESAAEMRRSPETPRGTPSQTEGAR